MTEAAPAYCLLGAQSSAHNFAAYPQRPSNDVPRVACLGELLAAALTHCCCALQTCPGRGGGVRGRMSKKRGRQHPRWSDSSTDSDEVERSCTTTPAPEQHSQDDSPTVAGDCVATSGSCERDAADAAAGAPAQCHADMFAADAGPPAAAGAAATACSPNRPRITADSSYRQLRLDVPGSTSGSSWQNDLVAAAADGAACWPVSPSVAAEPPFATVDSRSEHKYLSQPPQQQQHVVSSTHNSSEVSSCGGSPALVMTNLGSGGAASSLPWLGSCKGPQSSQGVATFGAAAVNCHLSRANTLDSSHSTYDPSRAAEVGLPLPAFHKEQQRQFNSCQESTVAFAPQNGADTYNRASNDHSQAAVRIAPMQRRPSGDYSNLRSSRSLDSQQQQTQHQQQGSSDDTPLLMSFGSSLSVNLAAAGSDAAAHAAAAYQEQQQLLHRKVVAAPAVPATNYDASAVKIEPQQAEAIAATSAPSCLNPSGVLPGMPIHPMTFADAAGSTDSLPLVDQAHAQQQKADGSTDSTADASNSAPVRVYNTVMPGTPSSEFQQLHSPRAQQTAPVMDHVAVDLHRSSSMTAPFLGSSASLATAADPAHVQQQERLHRSYSSTTDLPATRWQGPKGGFPVFVPGPYPGVGSKGPRGVIFGPPGPCNCWECRQAAVAAGLSVTALPPPCDCWECRQQAAMAAGPPPQYRPGPGSYNVPRGPYSSTMRSEASLGHSSYSAGAGPVRGRPYAAPNYRPHPYEGNFHSTSSARYSQQYSGNLAIGETGAYSAYGPPSTGMPAYLTSTSACGRTMGASGAGPATGQYPGQRQADAQGRQPYGTARDGAQEAYNAILPHSQSTGCLPAADQQQQQHTTVYRTASAGAVGAAGAGNVDNSRVGSSSYMQFEQRMLPGMPVSGGVPSSLVVRPAGHQGPSSLKILEGSVVTRAPHAGAKAAATAVAPAVDDMLSGFSATGAKEGTTGGDLGLGIIPGVGGLELDGLDMDQDALMVDLMDDMFSPAAVADDLMLL